jgi:hypothetical protein
MFTTPRLKKGLFIVFVALTTAGLASAQATGSKKTAPKKSPGAETYTKVEDTNAFGLHIETELTMLRGTPDDNGPVTGKVTSLIVAGKPAELVTHDIVDDAWVVTKAFGRIKVTGAYSGGLVIWLTPSQRTQIKALLQSSKSGK